MQTSVVITPSPPPATPTNVEPAKRPVLMAHYMPWYQTPAVSGAWGWHWTMNHYNPDQKNANGQQDIASREYPLTGPYDSSDDAVLEYQVLLMKLSGIDGVIVDWYGIEDFNDFGAINSATRKLFQYVKKAGLKFAICYEDSTVKTMIAGGRLNAQDANSHAQKVMQYLQDNWFRDDAYLKSAGRPVLFTFGNPPYFSASSDWESFFKGISPTPLLITEDDPIKPIGAGSYPWPPMFLAGGGELSQATLTDYLKSFYNKAKSSNYHVGGAFPGFHEIYKEAGVGASYGYLDARDGATFSATLQMALQSNPDVIQIATWNDYGEGTSIEPTAGYGDRYLKMAQDVRRAGDAGFHYTASDLGIPLQIFNLRKLHKGTADATGARLNQAFDAVIAGRMDEAKTLIAK